MINVKEKIKNGDYENKKPFSPATINLNKYIEYENETNRLNDQFKKDLFEEFKPDKNVQDLLYNIAYEQGHYAGYMEIYNRFVELLNSGYNELQELA